jgi:hypothetical protein
MVPGFLALGLAGLVMPASRRTRPLVRATAVGTVLAGAFRCSDVRCPDPFRDPEATTEDAAHAASSIVTFIVWAALPFVDASEAGSTRARLGNMLLGTMTAIGFVGAAVTARSDHPRKGLAQRFFLGAVLSRYAFAGSRAIETKSAT